MFAYGIEWSVKTRGNMVFILTVYPISMQFVLSCWVPDPVPPLNLTFENTDSLITGMVFDVFQEDPSAYKREMDRA